MLMLRNSGDGSLK